MKLKLKLRVEDLEVSSFPAQGTGGVHAAAQTQTLVCDTYCRAETGYHGGPQCVTEQYGGGETCETGPVYYC